MPSTSFVEENLSEKWKAIHPTRTEAVRVASEDPVLDTATTLVLLS